MAATRRRTPRTWCFTGGAVEHVFRNGWRVVAVSASADEPPAAMSAYVARVRREPVSSARRVFLTPFTVAADALLSPFELLAIRSWW